MQPWSHCLHTEGTSAMMSPADPTLMCSYAHMIMQTHTHTHIRFSMIWGTHTQMSNSARCQVEQNPPSPRLTSSSIPPLAWLLMQSHKCHITSSGGSTNRNINMGKKREKSFFYFAPFLSLTPPPPPANRLAPNPAGMRGDKLFLIGYIEINKHMSVANGSTLQKANYYQAISPCAQS